MAGHTNGKAATTAAASADKRAPLPADTREAVAARLQQEGEQHQDQVDHGGDEQNLLTGDWRGRRPLPKACRFGDDEADDAERDEQRDPEVAVRREAVPAHRAECELEAEPRQEQRDEEDKGGPAHESFDMTDGGQVELRLRLGVRASGRRWGRTGGMRPRRRGSGAGAVGGRLRRAECVATAGTRRGAFADHRLAVGTR